MISITLNHLLPVILEWSSSFHNTVVARPSSMTDCCLTRVTLDDEDPVRIQERALFGGLYYSTKRLVWMSITAFRII